LAWLTTDPILQVNRSIDLALAATNLLLSGAVSAAIATAYGWFTTGRPNAAMAARGLVSGLIAATAGAAFVPAWGALVIGAVTGLWMPIGLHAIERWLKLDDASGFVAMTGFAGLWSMLAAGLLADGTYGAGWNGIGVAEYLGVAGQGITGLFAAANLQNDPGQMSAQLTGALAVGAAAFIVTWLVLRPFRRARD
jgi:ammonium transporter, Amt family